MKHVGDQRDDSVQDCKYFNLFNVLIPEHAATASRSKTRISRTRSRYAAEMENFSFRKINLLLFVFQKKSFVKSGDTYLTNETCLSSE